MATKANPEEIIQKYGDLNSDRGTYLSHLQEVADYMAPSQAAVLTQLTEGGKRMEKIYDGTQLRCVDNFANGMFANLTPVSSPWFAMGCRNKALNEIPSVKFWLSDTTERIRSAINTSNAGMALFEIYKLLGWAGTGVLYIDKGVRYALNFKAFSPAVCVWEEDPNGIVDSLYRLEKFTARKAVLAWGENVSGEIKKAYINKENTKTFEILHAVYPRNDYDWSKRDGANMKYASVYLEKETKHILNESGYKEFPYAVPRWDQGNGEVTGRSPGMNALPDVKQLQQVVYDNTMAHQMWLRPPILASKESALSTNRFTPGKIVYHRTGEKPEPFPITGDLRVGLEEVDKLRQAIREAFYNDLFVIIQEQIPGRTAYEIRELIEQKLNLLGPFLGRLMIELLDVMLSRSFWLLFRNGFIAPVPKELIDQGIDVEYTGRLALAMKRYETTSTMDSLQLTQQVAGIDPTVVDNWNLDEVIQGTAQRGGVPVKYLRPPQERDKIREARNQQQQAMQESQEALEVAGQVPNLSKAPEEGSPAEALMKAMAGG